MNADKFTILVNSSDGFQDCWGPFFSLFETYWPQCHYPIILNTETTGFHYDGLNITASVVGEDAAGERLTWSQCLIKALEQVKTPLVLYFQEDYFLEAPVNTAFVETCAERMISQPEIKYVGLTHFGNQPPFTPWIDDDLWVVGQKARYRIATQVGLWRRETLLSYLREDENGWMFEIFGSRRAGMIKELFLTINRDKFSPASGNYIFKYTHTGIIKGKWHIDMPKLFKEHGIQLDFNKRGFYKPKPAMIRKVETLRKLLKRPRLFFTRYFTNH